MRKMCSVPEWGRSPGGGPGNTPLPASIPAWRVRADRGAWRATVFGVARSWTRLRDWAHTLDLAAPAHNSSPNAILWDCTWSCISKPSLFHHKALCEFRCHNQTEYNLTLP